MVGTRTDSASADGQWQAVLMEALVVILFVIMLVGVVVAGLWTIAVSLSGSTRD